MKKNILFLTLAATTFSLAGFASADESLGTYDMSVTSTVLASSECTVTAPSTLNFDNIEGSHDIYSVSSGLHHAQLYLIEISGCKKGMKVSATVTGDADVNNASLLSTHPETAGAAQNVAIGFFDQVGHDLYPLIPVNSGHTQTRTINEFGEIQIPIQADVVLAVDQKEATAGTITANASVLLNYL